MPIKNYTTKINALQSIGEIQCSLAAHGARKVMIDYDTAGNPTGIAFAIQTENGAIGYQLPANVEGVKAALKRDGAKCDEAQAKNIAWRNIRDWVLAQMAFIDAGNVQMDEVFLPYRVIAQTKQTVYEAIKSGQFLLGE